MKRAAQPGAPHCSLYGPFCIQPMPGDAGLGGAQATIAQQAARIQDLEQRNAILEMEAKALRQARENDQARLASMQRRIRQLLREIYGPRDESHQADPAVVADLLRKPAPVEPDDHVEPGDAAAATPPPPSPGGMDAAGPSAAGADADGERPSPSADPAGGDSSTPNTGPSPDGAGSSTGAEQAPLPPAGARPPRTGRKPGGRMTLPEWLALQKIVVDLPESERIGSDGTPLPCIGHRMSWRFD